MKISVIGSGNGGQAIAGHMAAIGHDVRLYGRDVSIISQINAKGKITLRVKSHKMFLFDSETQKRIRAK